MPDCGYCEASFDDEGDYLDHLRSAHADELGPIDRRRVAAESADRELPTGPLALGAVILAAVAVVAYVVFLAGSGGGTPSDGEPYNVGGVHYHGTLEMVVAGEPVDFSQPQYQYRNTGVDAFHFEAGDGSQWHGHAEGVTIAWAMESLGITVTADTVVYEGTTYAETDPGTTISVTVNGEPVTPAEYELQEGDAVRIVVEVE